MPQTIRLIEREAPSSVLARALEAVRSYVVAPLSTAGYEGKLLARLWGEGQQTASGVAVSPENALTFSAVFDAVNQGSADVAKLPLDLRKRNKEEGSEPYIESKTYRLLKHEANPDMGAMDFRRTLQAHAMTLKGGFAEIERDGSNQPARLWPLTPDRVAPFIEKTTLPNGRYRSKLRYRIDGDAKNIIESADMIHIRGLGYDGYCAYSVIDKARQAIGLALASEKFAGAFFGNNANFGGVLAAEADVDEPQAKDIQDRIEKIHKGPDRAWRMLVLGAGFKYYRTGVTPSESQMDDVRSRQVEEVARFFNFPVHKLKNLDRATNNNVEHLDLDYYKSFLLTWITTWEQELNRKLISPLEARQQYVKHNVYAFLRGDTAAQTALFSALLDRGVANADEVRELMDWNPQPNGQGKVYLVQGAMLPKSKVEAIADSQIEKNKRPKATPAAPAAPPPDEPAPADRELIRLLEERIARADAAVAAAIDEARDASVRAAELHASGTASAAEAAAERVRADQHHALAAQTQVVADDLRRELATLQAAHTALTQTSAADVAEARRLSEVAAADVRTAEARATAAVNDATEARSLAERHEQAAAAARAALDVAQGERSTLEEARRAADAQAAEARARADQLESDRQALTQTADECRRAAQEAQLASERAASQAEVEIAAARDRLAVVEQALRDSEEGRAAITAERTALAEAERAAAAARVTAESAAEEARAAVSTAETAAAAARAAQEAAEARAREAAAETLDRVAEATALLQQQETLASARETAEASARAAGEASAEADRRANAATDALAAAHASEQAAASAAAAREADLVEQLRQAEASLATERQAAERHQHAATDATAALATARDELTRLATALDTTRESHQTAIAALQTTIAAHERALDQHRGQVDEHRARAVSLEAVVVDRDRALVQLRQADAGAMTEVIAAHRALVADIMRRMVERETDRARQHQNRPDKFRQWVETFYGSHADVMRQALLPAIRVHLAFLRSDEPPLEATRRIVDAHVAESLRQITLVLEGDAESIAASLPALWYRWDTERSTVLADSLMQKEIEYARRF